MDKKGTFKITKEMILWLAVRFVIIFVVVFFIINLFGGYFSSRLDVDNIQQFVLRQRLILNKDCLAYEGVKVYGGIIDINKFNETMLRDCLKYELPKKGIGMKLNLTYDGISKEVYINPGLGNKVDFCIDKKNFFCTSTDYYVLVYDNGLKKGNLRIETVKLI
ncbi:MAG: hypothetical protein V1663_00060 [archaeon]